jgi:hypothetical protein
MSFNPESDKIAITIPRFKVFKPLDSILQKYSEPYIVSLAIDSDGDRNPKIHFNQMPFPKVAAGGTVTMLGDGHIVYGPKNPGEFVALSILVMECDKDIRNLGKTIKDTVESEVVKLGIKAIVAANPGHAAIIGILKELTSFVAGVMKNNGDDQVFRTEGSFLRDHPVPYHINRSYETGNTFAQICLNIIPLAKHNRQGPAPEQLPL